MGILNMNLIVYSFRNFRAFKETGFFGNYCLMENKLKVTSDND